MCNNGDEKTAVNDLPVPMEKLTQPTILMLLAQNNAHGYELIQKLNQIDCIGGEMEAATAGPRWWLSAPLRNLFSRQSQICDKYHLN